MPEQAQEIPQMQPVQPVPVEPKKKPSFLKIIVIPLIVILLIAGGVYAGMQISKKSQVKVWTEPPLTEITPEPAVVSNETSNWETYTNIKYGFQFKYPPEMTIKEDNLSENNVVVELNSQDGEGIEILYYNNPNKLTLEEFVKEINNEPDRGQDFFIHPELAEKKEFNEITVYYDRDALCEPLFCTLVSIPYQDKIFVIIYQIRTHKEAPTKYQEAPATEEELKFLDQILSTFKFLP